MQFHFHEIGRHCKPFKVKEYWANIHSGGTSCHEAIKCFHTILLLLAGVRFMLNSMAILLMSWKYQMAITMYLNGILPHSYTKSNDPNRNTIDKNYILKDFGCKQPLQYLGTKPKTYSESTNPCGFEYKLQIIYFFSVPWKRSNKWILESFVIVVVLFETTIVTFQQLPLCRAKLISNNWVEVKRQLKLCDSSQWISIIKMVHWKIRLAFNWFETK